MANEAAERKLMESIRQAWGAGIQQFCPASGGIPPAFVAALIANESGGRVSAFERFEPGVYRKLLAVRAGRLSSYAGVTQEMLRGLSLTTMTDIATSWGLTHIMGYHALRLGVSIFELLSGPVALGCTMKLLAEFVKNWRLDPTKDFEQLFRCWNTGSPVGETYDPQYVPLGLLRMRLYEEGASRP